MAGGRPKGSDEYRPEYDAQAEKLALLGLTIEEMAVAFDVSASTIYVWKNKYQSFSEALKNGKAVADGNVAASLYKRAMGYKKEREIMTESGVQIVMEDVPPDPTAMIFWLKNRRPAQWRDKQELKVENDASPVSELVSGIVRGLQDSKSANGIDKGTGES